MRRLLIIPLLAAVLAADLAAAEPVAVTPELAKVLNAAMEQTDPAKALALLDAYKGPEHAVLHMTRGQQLLSLANAAPAGERDKRYEAAIAAFNAALKLDPSQRQTHLFLAQIASERGQWTDALAHCGAGLDLAEATTSELAFYIQCAFQAKDWRLATTIVTHGIARYPAERRFRRYELALLVNGGRTEEARQAALALLDAEPGDADLWRQLRWSANETKREEEALAALEIALITKPDDASVRRQLAQAQLGSRMPQAALATILPLMEGQTDAAVVELAARIAAEAGDLAKGRAWLAAVPADKRTRGLRLLVARLALQAQDPAAGLAALKELIALGEQDASVLTWAGQAAEQANDLPAAEAFYVQAVGSDQPASGIASMRLVALYLKQERLDDAQTLLASHLAKRPDDVQAKALLAQLSRKNK